jgi:oligoribonuclease NrnB/cAMP/cGMP phosphodiesterase (DHH superfamily)
MNHIFYHYPCNDGELAKVIWETKYPKSKFYRWDHKDVEKSINILKTLSDTVVFLDVCPSINVLPIHLNIIIIDHHENAVIRLKELSNYENIQIIYDIKKSGCMLTWEYCYNEPMPLVVKHIGDKDIWNFGKDTEAYSLGYSEYLDQFDSELRTTMIKILLSNYYYLHKVFIEKGNQLLDKYKAEASKYFDNMKIRTEYIDREYKIIDIECSNNNIYKYLIELAPDADVLRILHTSNIKKTYSLRSLKPDICVDGIARFYGGNGHKKAAGYSV